MRKQNVLWKKRIAFLLSVALIGGEIGSNVNIINAAEVPGNTLTAEAEQNTEKEIQKTVPVPKEYISLNETEEVEENVPINGDLKADDGEDIIPIIGKDDWKVEEQETEVTEEDVNSDSEEVAQEMLPSVIPVIGSEEVEVTPVTVDASDVTTPAAITVGDVISRNGYEEIVYSETGDEAVTEQYSFVAEESGYYAFELTQRDCTMVYVSVENEGNFLAGGWLYTYSNYTDFVSCKLEAGKNYIWNVRYYSDWDAEEPGFTLEFKKNQELQVNGNQVSGTAGEISSFQYEMAQSGLVQISLESEQGYSYYLSSNEMEPYKISNDNTVTLFYKSASNATYHLWKNVEVEDKVTLTIQTVQASDIGKTNVLKTVQASTLKSYNGNGTKVAWASFTPKDSGLYAFETQIEIEDEAVDGSIYEYQEEDSSGYYSYYTGFSNMYGSGIVELIGGHTYYYRISQEYGSESEVEALTAYQVMVTKVESQKVTVGSKITLDKPAQLTFDDESAKFYQLCVTSEDGNSYVVELQNLQSFGGRYWGTNENLNSKIYNSGTGEGTLMITRTQNLATQGSYSVEIKEYDVPEVQENVIQENEETLESGNYMIRQFTPETDGTYNFWGISYANVRKYRAFFGIYQIDNGYFSEIDSIRYTDEFDMAVNLTGGVTYYLVNRSDTKPRFIPKPGDLIFCHGQAETASIDLSSSTEGKAEISMYKSAKIQMNLPEAGFYQLTAAGSADSYHINYDDTYTLYKGISKTVYFSESGECTINLSREFPKGSGKDTVTFEIKKNDSMTELKTYTKENPATQEVVLGDSGDVCWYQFTPTETGNYTFISDGDEDETDVYLQFYVKDGDNSFLSSIDDISYGSDCCHTYRLRSNLQSGTTYYIKATTDYNGAIADILVLKNVEGSIGNLEKAVTINTLCGAEVKCNIPEDGLYEISIQAQKDGVRYGLWDGIDSTTWDNQNGVLHYEYRYFAAGLHNIAFTSCGNIIGEDAITVKVSPVKAETVMKDITMDKSEVWVKYTPEESGYYTIGGILEQDVLEEDYTICASVYQKTADKELSSLTGYWNHDNSFEESVYLEKGYEYFIEFYSRTVPTNLTVYAQKNEMVEGTFGEELELTFSKRCNITFDNLTSGFYEITLEGDGNDYSVAFGYGDEDSASYNCTSSYSFKDKTTQTIYLGCNEIEGWSKQFFVITKAGTPTESSCKVTIKKVIPTIQELTLGTTVTKTATSNVECYSFVPDKTGYYDFANEGILDDIYYTRNDSDLNYWLNSYLYAGDIYHFYILNQKDTEYSLTLTKKRPMYVYDYNTYNAFIASGGSISIMDEANITEDMWENDNYSMTDTKDGKYIVSSVEKFKNQNDIWHLHYAAYMWIDDNATTYSQVEEDLIRNGHSTNDPHTPDYHYKYLCDSKGRTLTGSSELESPYMAYAVYAPVYVPVNSITIHGISALSIGATTKLTAQLDTGINFEPSNSEVTWSSSDSSIVSVDNQGNIKANKAGKAVITCKSQDRAGKSGSITIVVSQNAVYASKVVITGATKVNVGSSITLKATIDTAGKGKPTKDGVTWTTSDKTVAKVDKNGKVTGVSAGKVTITATSNDGKAKADYTITVKNVNAKKISLNESKITMKKGTTYKWLDVSFSPKNTTNQKIKWTTSNKKVATVDSKGRIKAKGIGKAVITATSSNGKKDSVKVTVTKDSIKTKKIKLSAKKNMKVGETLKLKPVFTPINTTNQKVKWTSSNTKVATVNSKGVVKAKKSGKVTITVTTLDGTKKTAKCKITVKKR